MENSKPDKMEITQQGMKEAAEEIDEYLIGRITPHNERIAAIILRHCEAPPQYDKEKVYADQPAFGLRAGHCEAVSPPGFKHVEGLNFDVDEWVEAVSPAAPPQDYEEKYRQLKENWDRLSGAAPPQDADEQILKERDDAEEWADKLAYAIGEHFNVTVGEHSSSNDPRREAMKILNGEYVMASPAAPQPTAQWISVEERLPPEKTRVLVWFREHDSPKSAYSSRFGEIACGHWRPEGGNGNFDDRITYWMPDLDPPKLEAQPTAQSEK